MENPGIGTYLSLALMLGFLALNALFVAAEFALIAVRRTQVKQLLDEGASCASLIDAIKKRQDQSIAGAQLGITLASLAIGWLGESSIHEVVLGAVTMLPADIAALIPKFSLVVITFTVMSVLHVVIGEQVPKIVALRIPIRILQLLAVPFRTFCLISAPLIWLMHQMTRLLLRPFGLSDAPSHLSDAVESEEYKHLFEESEKAGNIERGDRLLLQNALRWAELSVAQAMRPRNKVDFISGDISLDELVQVCISTKHSKLPVYEGTSDNIIGVFYSRDLLELLGKTTDFDIKAHMREPHFAPESMDISALFEDMRTKRYQIAIVTDEFGGTAGIVTQEDILERLVGDIEDEHDPDALPLIAECDDGTWLIRGETLLVTVNQQLGVDIVSPTGQTTIAGAVVEELDRQPENGDCVVLQGMRFLVDEVAEQAIVQLKATRITPDTPEDCSGTTNGETPH